MLRFVSQLCARYGKRKTVIGLGDPMVAPRRLIALPTDEEQRQRLLEISRSRTEPTSRVERARIILAYLEEPSAYAVAQTIGVTQQTVTRCLERAAELGVIEALDDRPRAGRDPVITAEAKTWLVALACQKPKELGYPHELWTTRLLAAHARQHASLAGHPSLGKLAQGTVCRILAEPEVKPHKSLPSRKLGCATTWRSAIPSSSPRWPKSSASTGKWQCCAGKREAAITRAKTVVVRGASRSCPTTRNQGSRRSLPPRRIARPFRIPARP